MKKIIIFFTIFALILFILLQCSPPGGSSGGGGGSSGEGETSSSSSSNSSSSSSSSIYTIIYDGNNNTDGTVPIDTNTYQTGDRVTVLGNTENFLKINVYGISYCFTGWNTQADGNGITYAEGQKFTMGITNIILYAKWEPYVLRDIGPAGGYIFYDKGSYSDGWRYLEAAPIDQSNNMEWGGYGTLITGADSTAIGTGKQNTIDIVTQLGPIDLYAARLCYELTLGGYNDWFLPSKDELNQMYLNLYEYHVGDFDSHNYWSSTEESVNTAWLQYFHYGTQYTHNKNVSFNEVRAIRAF